MSYYHYLLSGFVPNTPKLQVWKKECHNYGMGEWEEDKGETQDRTDGGFTLFAC